MVDVRLAVGEYRCAVGADTPAGAAADAFLLLYLRLTVAVLLHLARTGTAAHADVLYRTAEARFLVTLKMRQRNKHVRIHDGGADLRFLDVLAVYGNEGLVRAFKPVGDYDVAADLHGRKAVHIRRVDVVEGVLAASDVQRVAVGEEGSAGQLLDVIRNYLCVIGTQESEVPVLAEVHFYRCKLVLKVDALKARLLHKAVQLLQEIFVHSRFEVGEIDL